MHRKYHQKRRKLQKKVVINIYQDLECKTFSANDINFLFEGNFYASMAHNTTSFIAMVPANLLFVVGLSFGTAPYLMVCQERLEGKKLKFSFLLQQLYMRDERISVVTQPFIMVEWEMSAYSKFLSEHCIYVHPLEVKYTI